MKRYLVKVTAIASMAIFMTACHKEVEKAQQKEEVTTFNNFKKGDPPAEHQDPDSTRTGTPNGG
jgi:hypothetical protein